eukprot:CAMPEP_0172624654 /NCGR_PEP_ID=MMETSP1068-20121228/138419_1 /TAXON_ID=35684 /ORGANISM="Pseudopedinella elastica, Strain CCMP716" /LENGTH=416 /DNA_ID=CAMNT_0013433703 /DNA_START=264 /DNA_END=1514 /DNA_ORIENTATION=+
MEAASSRSMRFIGHRGASARFPENTRSSITAALKEAHGSEFDVQRTRDGRLVVLHDDDLKRTARPWQTTSTAADEHGPFKTVTTNPLADEEYEKLIGTPVCDLDFAQIENIRVGWPRGHDRANMESDDFYLGESLLDLPAALKLLKIANAPFRSGLEGASIKRFLIEIKGGDDEAAALVARDLIQANVVPDEITLIGFSLCTMAAVKALLPHFSANFIEHQKSEEDALEAVRKAAEAGLDGVDLCADTATVTSRVGKAAKEVELELIVWVWSQLKGCDSLESWKALEQAGVDTFTTDMPEGLFVADLHSGYNPLVCRLSEPREAKMRFETKPARSPSPEVAVQVDLLRLMLPEFTTIDGDSLKDTTATQSPEIRTALPLTDTFFEPPDIGEVKWASLPDVVAVGEKGRTREVSPIE